MVTVVTKEMMNWCEWDQMRVIELIYNSTAADASDSSPFNSVQCQLETSSSVLSDHCVMSSDHLLAGLPWDSSSSTIPNFAVFTAVFLPLRTASSLRLCNVVILPFLWQSCCWLVFPTHSPSSTVIPHLKQLLVQSITQHHRTDRKRHVTLAYQSWCWQYTHCYSTMSFTFTYFDLCSTTVV